MRSLLASLALLATTLPTWAGSLDAPAAPTAGSGMPTTADLYNRLDTGATFSVPGTFQEPAAGPTAGTGKTLGDIATKLPAPDNTHGAAAGDVANGKTFWGLRTDGTWGLTTGNAAAVTPASGNATAGDVLSGKTFSNSSATGLNGNMADNGAVSITPGTSAQTIPAGFHNGSGSVAGDANLVSSNIKSGATIFGVSGNANVVDTTETTAPASAADIRSGKNAYVNGTLVNGTLAVPNTTHVAAFSCQSHWSGSACDVCANGWSGPNCDVCPSGWTGTNCDIISMPFSAGAMPSYSSTPWNCVLDTDTGLTWEVKSSDGGLHDLHNTYTWYSSSDADHGTATTGSCIGTNGCDTEKFAIVVGVQKFCGYSDWRVPSVNELEGLNIVRPTPTIDTAYFPDMGNVLFQNFMTAPGFWSRESWNNTPGIALAYFFVFSEPMGLYGYSVTVNKQVGLPLRLVRP
jgi:hypothetical protein